MNYNKLQQEEKQVNLLYLVEKRGKQISVENPSISKPFKEGFYECVLILFIVRWYYW